MAEIRSFPFVRHLRAEPTAYVALWKRGKRRRAGAGQAFWFMPLGASVTEVPLDDRELAFVFRCRSADFQEVAVNGAVIWRVADPDLVATRIDFSLDPATGRYNKDPLDRLAQVVTGPAQNLAATFLARSPLRAILDQGVEVLRRAIHDGLLADESLGAMGLEIVATAVSSVAPSADLEKALQMPTREKIQQTADEATFERRALAVAKERAIQENELENQIELARREEQLIAQRGQNERRRAGEAAESKRIESEADAVTVRLRAGADADGTRLLEGARVDAERARIDIYRELPATVLLGLAANELAGKLHGIDHLSLAPDGISAALQRLFDAGADKLKTAKAT
jgi:hypothetical protein